jgi:hypothetical protein
VTDVVYQVLSIWREFKIIINNYVFNVLYFAFISKIICGIDDVLNFLARRMLWRSNTKHSSSQEIEYIIDPTDNFTNKREVEDIENVVIYNNLELSPNTKHLVNNISHDIITSYNFIEKE